MKVKCRLCKAEIKRENLRAGGSTCFDCKQKRKRRVSKAQYSKIKDLREIKNLAYIRRLKKSQQSK